jgi:colicin import membrane protein
MQDPTETSVLISLRELVALEGERLAEEQVEREHARDRMEREHAAELERRRVAEEARLAAEGSERARRARDAAEEAARLHALRHAEVERARIRAEAAVQREVTDAQFKHERDLMRIEQERKKGQLKLLGIVGLVVTLMGAGGAALFAGDFLGAERDVNDARVQRIAGEQQAMFRKRLAALDTFHEQLRSQLEELNDVSTALEDTRTQVQRARAAVEPKALEDARLDALQDALRTMARELTRSHRVQRLASLDGLHSELLDKLKKVRHHPKGLKKADEDVRSARRRVNASDPEEASLTAFDRALSLLGIALGGPKFGGPTPSPPKGEKKPDPFGPCQGKGDPLCGRLPGE